MYHAGTHLLPVQLPQPAPIQDCGDPPDLGDYLIGRVPPTLFGIGMQWMAFLFATPVVLYGGWVFIQGTYYALLGRKLDMSVLIFTGVAAAYLFSAGITIGGGTDVFFEAAAMLITFVLFGHWMEMRSRRGTTDALQALLNLVPEKAIVVRDGQEIEAAGYGPALPRGLRREPSGSRQQPGCKGVGHLLRRCERG